VPIVASILDRLGRCERAARAKFAPQIDEVELARMREELLDEVARHHAVACAEGTLRPLSADELAYLERWPENHQSQA
jgi:hypothetical protein